MLTLLDVSLRVMREKGERVWSDCVVLAHLADNNAHNAQVGASGDQRSVHGLRDILVLEPAEEQVEVIDLLDLRDEV